MQRFEDYLSEANKIEGPLPQLYLDLDGVMADFMAGAHEELGHAFDDRSTRSKKEIWAKMDANKTFWHDLPPMKDALVLWKFIKKYDPQILSAVPNTPDAVSGKKHWLKKHLKLSNPSKINLVKRHQKVNYVTKDGVDGLLIDDYIKNIKEFKAAGGVGVRHTSAQNTIKQLKKLGY